MDKSGLGCSVGANGEITIFVLKNGKPKTITVFEPHIAANFISTMLALSAESALKAGLGKGGPIEQKSESYPVVVPTGFRLTDKTSTTPAAIVLQLGRVQFGIAIPDARSLGEALIATSAESGTSH